MSLPLSWGWTGGDIVSPRPPDKSAYEGHPIKNETFFVV